LTVIAQFLSQY